MLIERYIGLVTLFNPFSPCKNTLFNPEKQAFYTLFNPGKGLKNTLFNPEVLKTGMPAGAVISAFLMQLPWKSGGAVRYIEEIFINLTFRIFCRSENGRGHITIEP